MLQKCAFFKYLAKLVDGSINAFIIGTVYVLDSLLAVN